MIDCNGDGFFLALTGVNAGTVAIQNLEVIGCGGRALHCRVRWHIHGFRYGPQSVVTYLNDALIAPQVSGADAGRHQGGGASSDGATTTGYLDGTGRTLALL